MAIASPAPSLPDCDALPDHGIEDFSGESAVLAETDGEVPAQANIFGAGREAPPAPGGGDRGLLPPVFNLPSGAREVTFPSITGEVTPIVGSAGHPGGGLNGPNGDRGENGSTEVRSYQGISGIVDRINGMFVVGVFLTDAPPKDPAPPRLDFTNANERGFALAPEIGQVFFIGDGNGRTYIVPEGATRLFLGFADAYLYEGCPGWYNNNSGEAKVDIEVTTD